MIFSESAQEILSISTIRFEKQKNRLESTLQKSGVLIVPSMDSGIPAFKNRLSWISTNVAGRPLFYFFSKKGSKITFRNGYMLKNAP
jgi:hypothetical protein